MLLPLFLLIPLRLERGSDRANFSTMVFFVYSLAFLTLFPPLLC